jgi:4-hydroxybenzoate polyprenyltransferase
VLLIAIGGYLINDVFDINTDVINKPNKVYIDQILSFKKAIYLSILFSLIGFLLGTYLSIITNSHYLIGVFLFCIFSLLFYSFYLKKRILLGNILVSILCSSTILLTYFFHLKAATYSLFFKASLYHTILGYVFFAFLTTLIREIIKDIEDVDGDIHIKATTLPIVIGRKRTSKVAFLFSCILLVFLFLSILSFRTNYLFFGYGILFIMIPFVYFMSKLWFSESKKDFSKLSVLLKIIMLLGIISMLLFKIET